MSKKYIKHFGIWSGILLLLCILAVVVFDPFFSITNHFPGLRQY